MFNDTVMPFGNGRLDNVVETDSFYYIGGIHSGINTNNKKQFFLLKYDKNGILINKRMYKDYSFSYGLYPYNSMIYSKNKIFSVFQAVDSTGYVKARIVVLNKNSLDTIWSKTYKHPDSILLNPSKDKFNVFTAIKETPDDKYILVGNYMSNGNLRSFLMKIDSVGNVEWRRVYNSYYTFFDIEVTPDSGYLIPSTYNGNRPLKVSKFDKNGIYKWSTTINNNTYSSYPCSVSLLGNNYAIVASSYWYDVNNSKSAVTVAKVDINTGTAIWEKNYYTYSSFDCITLHQAMGVETLPNGDIIVSGTANRYGHDAVILKLNSNGDSLWCKSYDYQPDNWDCQLNDLILTDDGGFLGVGFFSDHNTGWTAWMFKTDANGVVGFENTKEKVKSGKYKVYPNPAKSYTTLEFDKALIHPLDIKVYNTLGQMLLQTTIEKGASRIKLDLSGFEAGLYYYELQNQAQTMGSGKFVVE